MYTKGVRRGKRVEMQCNVVYCDTMRWLSLCCGGDGGGGGGIPHIWYGFRRHVQTR